MRSLHGVRFGRQFTSELVAGTSVPVLGFGTWELPKKEATNATKFALQHGIRLIDTAAICEAFLRVFA